MSDRDELHRVYAQLAEAVRQRDEAVKRIGHLKDMAVYDGDPLFVNACDEALAAIRGTEGK